MTAIAFWGDSLVAGMINPTDSPAIWGDNVLFDGGLSGDTAQQISVRQLADRAHRYWPQVIWAGQNVTTPADLKNYVAAMVAALQHDKFLIVSVINAGMTGIDQGPSGSRYLDKMDCNSYFDQLYGSKFLNLHRQLVDYGRSISDAQSVNFDAPPSTYQPVDIHLTGTGGYAFANQKVYDKLSALGYLASQVKRYGIGWAGGV